MDKPSAYKYFTVTTTIRLIAPDRGEAEHAAIRILDEGSKIPLREGCEVIDSEVIETMEG